MDLEDDLCEDFQVTLQLTEEDRNIQKGNEHQKANIFLIDSNEEKVQGNDTPAITSFSKELKETVWGSGTTREDKQNNGVIKPISPISSGTAMDFFTFRESVIEHAVNECMEQFLDVKSDGTLVSAYLITEVSLWNTDKERLVLLTTKAVTIVKYDFIALKRLDCRKVPLNSIDTVEIGELTYPPTSLVPQLQGLVDGFSNVINRVFFEHCSKPKDTKLFDIFQYRKRNAKGIRLLWNKGRPVNFIEKWNPLNSHVPFVTLTSHPLLNYKECTDENRRRMYDVDNFIEEICTAIKNQQRENEGLACIITHKDIMLDNYVGLGSLIHNRNALGFFKVRGKLSF